MRALRLLAVNQLALADIETPVPGPGDVQIRLRAAALNHRDHWIKVGQYAGLSFPSTPGSDGAGVVESVGPSADPAWVGQEVIINPSFGWGPSEQAQGPDFSILGLPRQGTLAEYVVVPAVQVSPKPRHLTWEQAAALPLAGLTAYRALFSRAHAERGDRILITGIGGGVALFALQFAVAAGAEVWVSSSSPDKIRRAVDLGARGGFDYTQADWAKTAVAQAGPFSVVIDGASGPGLDNLLDASAPGGRIVSYGATRGNPSTLAARKVFWRQLSLLGTTMGSPRDWEAMLAFVRDHGLKPIISDVFPLERAADAFACLERNDQFGKVVISG
jgi:zinc-binding alcohol dehydrogenase/oxidoreductase